MSGELKVEWRGCPICNGEMEWLDNELDSSFVCQKCGYFTDFDGFTTKEEMLEWWNTRPLEDALRAERDAAVSMVERLIEAGQLMMMAYSAPYYDHIAPRENFNALIAEWSKEHGNVT